MFRGPTPSRKPVAGSEAPPGRAGGRKAPPVDRRGERLDALLALAAELVSPDRLTETGRRLIGGGADIPDDGATMANGLAFSLILAVLTAPPGRSTAVDRLIRRRRPASGSEEERLLKAMAQARFTLFVVEGKDGAGSYQARDLLSGDRFRLPEVELDGGAEPAHLRSAHLRLAAWLAVLGDERLIVGPALSLDDTLIDSVRSWRTSNGRAWINPVRAAEALYREVLRRGPGALPGFDGLFPGMEEPETKKPETKKPETKKPGTEPPFPLSPGDGPVHALAFRWSLLPPGREPDPESLRQARALSSDGAMVMEALGGAVAGARFNRPALVAAYERLLAIMLDALQRRAAVGQQGAIQVLAWMEREITQSIVPPEVRALYHRLKRGTGGDDATGGRDAGGLDRLRGRIQALRAKTVDQGCTEEEALSAAAKVAELLDRYGLSLSEMDFRRQTCEGQGVETGRKRRAPIDDCIGSIAVFCDCRCWHETTPDGLIRHVFFGLPADVAGAHYLYDLIVATLQHQTEAFRAGELYRKHHSSQRASANRSFQVGLIYGIAKRLGQIKQERDAGIRSAHGRDLVPVKDGMIDEELDKLGLTFRSRTRSSGRRVLSDAYQAGQEAGADFEYRPGLQGPPAS